MTENFWSKFVRYNLPVRHDKLSKYIDLMEFLPCIVSVLHSIQVQFKELLIFKKASV